MTAYNGVILPPLREDLEFLQRGDGKAGWQIHDPVQHRFFSIGEDTKRLLTLWKGGATLEELLALARQRLGFELDPTRLCSLIEFLEKSNLVQHSERGSWKELATKGNAETPSLGRKLLSSYLFVRLPLLRPEPMLRSLAPALAVFYRPVFLFALGLIGLAGCYLSVPDMVRKFASPNEIFSGFGLVQIGVSLIILKLAHEWAHAVTAYRFGCRVPTMGIALMVFVPLLYTDVSDAWRLSSKRQRVLISAAGMIAEIILAALATFLWAFAENGALREILFYIATVGWVSSLAFNLNPLMKFDGYYILSDLTGIENLQSRAFALARWKLRQLLLVPSLVSPEAFSRLQTAMLIAYACLVWLYRLVIFTAISLLLYHFATKALGLVLMVATFWQLILAPVFCELAAWRQLVQMNEGARTALFRPALVTVFFLLLLFLPLSKSVYLPAVLTEETLQRVYPPKAARITEILVEAGQQVEAGEVLFRFETPELTSKLEKIGVEINAHKLKLARGIADRVERREVTVLQQGLASLQELQTKLMAEIGELEITSGVRGQVTQFAHGLRAGAWVARGDQLAIVRTGEFPIVRGYVREKSIARINKGDRGRFIPDDPTVESIPVILSRISTDSADYVAVRELASTYGGLLATVSGSNAALEPAEIVYEVELKPVADMPSPNQLRRGQVVLTGDSVSLGQKLYRRVASVLTREVTF